MRARDGEHLAALVDADDRTPFLPEQLGSDRARAGRDVENTVAGTDVEARDQEPPPAWILAEREDAGVALIGRAERREQLQGPCSCGRLRHAAKPILAGVDL